MDPWCRRAKPRWHTLLRWKLADIYDIYEFQVEIKENQPKEKESEKENEKETKPRNNLNKINKINWNEIRSAFQFYTVDHIIKVVNIN